MPTIDVDGHFIEPFDIYQRYTEPAFRDRAMRIERQASTGKMVMVVDNRALRFVNLEALLGGIVGYGQKEGRVRFLDEEGFD